MIKTGEMTSWMYEYKYETSKPLGEDHFQNLILIDTHEYVTRLANYTSTFGISFDIPNSEVCDFETSDYLLNESYRNDPCGITICN